jgi:uncharacterized protein
LLAHIGNTEILPHSVWQDGGHDVIYSDRSEEDKRLLIYTGSPLERDTEITGSPIVTLVLSSSHSDGALHVYLEDVALDGRVTYITEGISPSQSQNC